MPLRSRCAFRIRTQLAGGALAASLLAAPLAQACDCGCESAACDAMAVESCDCGCESSGNRKRWRASETPVFKALDALAGGIEKALRLDKDSSCDGGSVCDDACDASMIHELSQPLPPPVTQYHVPRSPVPVPPALDVPPSPAPVYPDAISPPSGDAGGLQRRPSNRSMTPLRSGPPIETPEPMERRHMDRRVMPAPNETLPTPGVDPQLTDPFEDDPYSQRQSVRRLRPVQYQRAAAPAPATRSRSIKSSRRGFLR